MNAETKRNRAIKALWKALTGRPWPLGWKLQWNVAGMTIPANQTIYLASASVTDSWDLEVLIHELVHLEHLDWPHGVRFEKRVKELMKEAKAWVKQTKRLRLK